MSLFELFDSDGNKHRTRHDVVLSFKINCDALISRDWNCIAAITALHTRPFRKVIGIERGGNPYAEALAKYLNPASERILIVDDVLTTGESFEKARREVMRTEFGCLDFNEQTMWPHGTQLIDGFVLFNRSRGKYDKFSWVKSLFTLLGDTDGQDHGRTVR
jgi:hypothetical protein